MADRYQIVKKSKLESLNTSCPVIVDSYAILYDTKDDKTVAQLKLLNQNPLTVQSCTVKLCSGSNDLLAEYEFTKQNAESGEFFGTRTPIDIPFNTDVIVPSVSRIAFADGSVWTEPLKNEIETKKELPELFPEDDELPDLDELPRFDDLELTRETAVPVSAQGIQSDVQPAQYTQQPFAGYPTYAPNVPVSQPAPAPIRPQGIQSGVQPAQYAQQPFASYTTYAPTAPVPQPVPAPKRKKTWPIFVAVGVVVVGMLVYFLLFWKSQAVKDTEQLIGNIGIVTYDSKTAIENAEVAYNKLNAIDKWKVSNSKTLTAAKERFEVVEEEYFQEKLAEYVDDLRVLSVACADIWLGDTQIIFFAGAEYIFSIREYVSLFDKNQSYYLYPSEYRDYLWIAAIAASKDNLSGASIKYGKEQEVISDCVTYNKEMAAIEAIPGYQKEIQTFAEEFSEKHPEETQKLLQWINRLVDVRKYLQNPETDLSISVDDLTDFTNYAVEMKDYFDK